MAVYRFGAFSFDLEREELRAGDRPIALPRKNLDLLRVLVESQGRLVPRESLVHAVWGETAVEEATIRQSIYTLRMMLREVDGREYVETVPKSGYRMSVPVELVNGTVQPEPAPLPTGSARRMVTAALAIVLPLILLTAWIARSRISENSRAKPIPAGELTREAWKLLDSRNSSLFPSVEALFDQALRSDPGLAAAHEGKAVLYTLEGSEGPAETEAARVAELNPASALPAAVRGFIRMMYHWDWSGGVRLLQVVQTRGCAQPVCRQWNALGMALKGDLAGSVREATFAVELATADLAPRAQRVQLLYWSGQTDAAITEAQTVLELGGVDTHVRYHLWKALLGKGDRHAAAAQALLAFDPAWFRLGPGDEFHQLQVNEGIYGQPEFWQRLFGIERNLHASPYFLAEIAMAQGDPEAAVEQLETCLQNRNFFLPFARRDPLFSPLHGNPRYQAVMKGVGL